ncbi:MAG: superoxide dismutase family protein [Flavobacteriaceae bacterium]|nr:superoxide dismutase family protein [Flavobacteriaceae bacterium]
MKKVFTFLIALATVLTVSCKKDKKETNVVEEDTNVTVEKTEDGEVKKLTIALNAKSNSNASGNIVFVEENGIVTMTAIISGLSEGMHAIHLHEKADCSAPDGTSTGGHWNPTGQPHGKWGMEEGFHKGDIGNFEANADGNGTITFSTDQWCIGCGDETKDILGKAVIVHEGQDDFVTQPTGAAGGRVSCGGIIE